MLKKLTPGNLFCAGWQGGGNSVSGRSYSDARLIRTLPASRAILLAFSTFPCTLACKYPSPVRFLHIPATQRFNCFFQSSERASLPRRPAARAPSLPPRLRCCVRCVLIHSFSFYFFFARCFSLSSPSLCASFNRGAVELMGARGRRSELKGRDGVHVCVRVSVCAPRWRIKTKVFAYVDLAGAAIDAFLETAAVPAPPAPPKTKN